MKVVIATRKPFASQALEEIKQIIQSAGHQFETVESYDEKSQLLDAVIDADALIVRSDIVDREVMEAAPGLKLVVRAGSGYDNIDIERATNRDICVMNTPGQNANAVAELLFGLMIYMQRNQFDGSVGRELYKKRLGLYAFGNVSRMVARIARGFNMTVNVFSPTMSPGKQRSEREYGVVTLQSSRELFENSDFVSLHMPLVEKTRGSVGYDLLSLMPGDGMLINTARKELVVEEELLQIMEERPRFRYITDVKPQRHEMFLSRYPERYYATPKKMGAQTTEANINAGLAAAGQVVSFFRSGNERFRVNNK